MVGDFKTNVNVEVQSPIQLKAEIKTEIPPESSGRLLDALTDLIRPFSEARGLRADQIRLQREEVLIEIAKRARERLRFEQFEPEPLSNKFFVPFLEKASLEDEKSPLVEKWANLLSTAAHGASNEYTWCINLLSEITPEDAKLLDQMYEHGSELINGVHFDHLSRAQLQVEFDNILSLLGVPFCQICEPIKSEFDFSWIIRGDDVPNTNEVHFNLCGLELCLARLESLGLLWLFAESTFVRSDDGSGPEEKIFVIAAQLTLKGRALVEACQSEIL